MAPAISGSQPASTSWVRRPTVRPRRSGGSPHAYPGGARAGPAITSSSSAASPTVRANGPTVS